MVPFWIIVSFAGLIRLYENSALLSSVSRVRGIPPASAGSLAWPLYTNRDLACIIVVRHGCSPPSAASTFPSGPSSTLRSWCNSTGFRITISRRSLLYTPRDLASVPTSTCMPLALSSILLTAIFMTVFFTPRASGSTPFMHVFVRWWTLSSLVSSDIFPSGHASAFTSVTVDSLCTLSRVSFSCTSVLDASRCTYTSATLCCTPSSDVSCCPPSGTTLCTISIMT